MMLDSSAYDVDKIEHALLREGWLAEGRLSAFSFALECHADVNCIQTELDDNEASVRETLASTSFGSNNPMTPGASPRIFRDAYIAGLRDAIQMIKKLSEENQQ